MESSNFWKNNVSRVPGKVNKNPSFQDYQESVSDAWSLGDDDICILSGDTKISKRVSQSAADDVIKTHKSRPSTSLTSQNESHHLAEVVDDLDNLKLDMENPDLDADAINENSVSSTNSNNNYRHRFHAYPGRPQLLKFSSSLNSKDDENEIKLDKFKVVLDGPLLNLKELKELSWSGVPKKMRPISWRLLSGYLPSNLERRNSVLERKRIDYQKLVQQYFHAESRDEETYHQIHIDVPRMNPTVKLFQQSVVQDLFERILFIWAIRHPASGYVQGINDLVTPFFIVFLQEALGPDADLESCKLETVALEKREIIEADAFWCLSKFLDCIQDNYIFAQLGIQAKVNQLKEIISRIDSTLHQHLTQHGIDYLQFSFRWMNNLLTRELPLHCSIRLWDTYLAESDEFGVFQLYVCAAFLLFWREQILQEKDFQGLMLLLQNLPTQNWTDSHIGVLVAEAFKLKFTYSGAPKHFEGKS